MKEAAQLGGLWLYDVPRPERFFSRISSDCGRLGGFVSRRQIRILYSGHVQGVGFRYTVKQVARGFEVTGKVTNLPDGRVELIAEGEKGELEAFRQAIRDEGLDHFIRDEAVAWSDAAHEFRGFEIGR